MTSKPQILVSVVFASIFNVLFICLLANSASKYSEQDRKMNRKELRVYQIIINSSTNKRVHFIFMPLYAYTCVEGHNKLILVVRE